MRRARWCQHQGQAATSPLTRRLGLQYERLLEARGMQLEDVRAHLCGWLRELHAGDAACEGQSNQLRDGSAARQASDENGEQIQRCAR